MTARDLDPTLPLPTVVKGAQGSSSLEALVSTHVDRAFSIASRFVPGDRAAAEDITQEAFAKAWLGLSRFRGEAELSTWLYRVVVNEAISHLRKKRLRDGFLTLIGTQYEDTAPPLGDPGLRARIEAALGALTANERATFVLVHLEGFTYEESAVILERRVGTIKSQLHRAIAKLRHELSTCWEERR